jgi:uncharacterized membrane protein (DUF106 family)
MSQRPVRPQQSREQQQAMQSTMKTQMLYFVVMILLLFVYTIPTLRTLFAIPMLYILQPVIGFNFEYPLFTILFAAIITGFVNTIARHFFTDYFAMAEMQHKNKKLSQRYREAIRSRNKEEMDAVRQEQSKSMQDSMKLTQQQMKPTFVTLILTVLIFAWLIGFMYTSGHLGYTTIASPIGNGNLMKLYYGFYAWIGVYSLFSITFTYPLQYGLKMWYIRRSVRNEGNYIRSAGQR